VCENQGQLFRAGEYNDLCGCSSILDNRAESDASESISANLISGFHIPSVDSGHSPVRRYVPRLDRSQRVIERQEASRHPPPDFLAVIPIGVFTLIDAGTAS
jgi:hypothetical protein